MTYSVIKKHAPEGLHWTGALALTAGLFLVSMLIVAATGAVTLNRGAGGSLRGLGTLTAAVSIPRQLLTVGVGVALALIAARLPASDAQSGHLNDLRLTPTSPSRIAVGYIVLALYRLRYGLAVLIGTLPIIHLLTVSVALLRLQTGRLDATVFTTPLITISLSVLGLLLTLTAMVSMGVALGLRFEMRGVGSAGVLAFFLLLLVAVTNNILPTVLVQVLTDARLLGFLNVGVSVGFLLLFALISVIGIVTATAAVRSTTT